VYVGGAISSTRHDLACYGKRKAQGSYGGGAYDGFIAKLSATGEDLLYFTYIGGNGDDRVTGLTVDTKNACMPEALPDLPGLKQWVRGLLAARMTVLFSS